MRKLLFCFILVMDSLGMQAHGMKNGYSGSVEAGCLTDFYDGLFQISTTHGKQFDERWFAGGGTTLFFYEGVSANIYAAGRCFSTRIGNERWRPYGELRFGLEIVDGSSPFIEPSAGVRINIGQQYALSTRVGLYCDNDGCYMSFSLGFHF